MQVKAVRQIEIKIKIKGWVRQFKLGPALIFSPSALFFLNLNLNLNLLSSPPITSPDAELMRFSVANKK